MRKLKGYRLCVDIVGKNGNRERLYWSAPIAGYTGDKNCSTLCVKKQSGLYPGEYWVKVWGH